jgi:tol-pal system protein YbgF
LCASSLAHAQSLPVPDHSTYPPGMNYAADTSSANTLYEILGRMEQLQTEVQQLRGTIEEQAHTIAQLKAQQNTLYIDLDQRLQALETGGAALVQPQEGAVEPSQSAASLPPESSTVTPATAKANEQQRYQIAYETLKKGHYSQAIGEFEQFLKDYPAGTYADNAQYWLGETYKVNRDMAAAQAAFSKVISNHPDSPKVPDALLKLGYIELDQNNIAQARDYFTQVTTRYPGTTAAQLATQKLQQLDSHS